MSASKHTEALFASKQSSETLAAGGHSTDTLSASKTSTETLSASKTSTETLSASKTSTDTLSASKHSTETLAASKHSTETLYASKHSSDNLSASKHSTETLDASKHSTETLAASKHSTETLYASKHSSDNLSASKTSTETLSASKHSTEILYDRKHSKEVLSASKQSLDTLSASKYSTDRFASQLSTETLSASRHYTETLSASKHSKETLTASKHSTETLSASKHSSETLSASKHSTETLTASKHSTETLSASKHSTETLTASKHSTDTLSASKHSTDTLTASKHSTETLTASKHSNETLSAGTHSAETFSGSKRPFKTSTRRTHSSETWPASNRSNNTLSLNPHCTDLETPTETMAASKHLSNTMSESTQSAETLLEITQSAGTLPGSGHSVTSISAAICSGNTESDNSSSSTETSHPQIVYNEKEKEVTENGDGALSLYTPVIDKAIASTSKSDVNPMTLAIPTKGQLLNAFGGGIGHFRAGVSDKTSDKPLLVGTIYILKSKVLGQGPSSIIYEGRLESLNGTPVAVKRVTCKNKQMADSTCSDMDEIWNRLKLYRERDLLRGIEQWRHPNIVGYYQSETVVNELYMAFQLCQGDLDDYVNEEFRFWRENISPKDINQNMAAGIEFLHANSIVHRDLKPKNIFLVWQQGNCRAVIGDFGMSKGTDKGVCSLSLSVGSIGFVAPEVWQEASKVVRSKNIERPKIDIKSDIFPLGLLFFFTITNGNHPYGDELLGSQLQIAAGCRAQFHHLRPEEFSVETLLRKMFSRNPRSRPTAEEVCDHPALWDDTTTLKFLVDCSDYVEKMVTDGKSIETLVPNHILLHGNWMRDLPDALRHYLKTRRVHGKLLYQGRESSTRYFLRAVRNITSHFPDLPEDVKDELTVPQSVFWTSKCPRLLMHLYNNIDSSVDFLPKRKKLCASFPPKKTTPQSKSSSKALVKTDGSAESSTHVKKDAGTSSSSNARTTPQYRGRVTYATDTILLPQTWIPMHVNESPRFDVLQTTSMEYRQVADRFINEARSGAYAHKIEFDRSKLKISQIERIQNKGLYQQFKVRRNQIAEEKIASLGNAPIVRQLWHGTTAESVQNIIKHGFNRGYSGKNGTWYGDGVYFAVDASYAARAWITECLPEENAEGHIFLADVITGEYCKGHYGMRYLPPVDPDDPTVLYDSAADQPDNPMEFVIFHDTQAYPSYHITFTCF